MSWDDKYKGNNRVWGDGPSELAALAVRYLQAIGWDEESLSILDVGCGYGRDAGFFAKQLNGKILGIDPSAEAIKWQKTPVQGKAGSSFGNLVSQKWAMRLLT